MQHSEEKPLIPMLGKPIIGLVIESLQNAKLINSIIVAVSPNAPRTAAYASKFPVKVVPTPGKGYIQDLQYLVKRQKLGKVLTISADLPLITGEIIDEILMRYQSCTKPALAVVTLASAKQKLGLGASHAFQAEGKTVVPVGINVIDGQKMENEELEQEILIMDRLEVAVNINTIEELALVERITKNT